MITKKYINKIGSKIKQGSLRVVFPNNEEFLFKGKNGLHGELILKSYKPIFRTVLGGHLGFAESYLKNEWDSPNLKNLLELMLQNLPNEFKAKSSLYKTYNRFIHFLRENTKIRAKKNIEYHYDIGNSFYEIWLDKSMTYSSALFKNDKEGLRGKYKIIGQIILGLIVGLTLFLHPEVTVKDQSPFGIELQTVDKLTEYKSTETTIPFVKDNVFNYSDLITWIDPSLESYTWIVFIFFVVLIIAAVSNGANLTDGLDGLAAGSSAIIVLTLGVFTWVSGNIIFSDYLNIMYIPRVGEITIFIGAFVGSLVGFLWYNTYPAQVFMGDTGSLTIGGIIAVISIAVRKEWLIPLICGIFLIENLSVIIQVFYFKYTRKKFGVGKRVFLMSPLHHHFQKKGYHESKIVTRFWIVGIFLAILSIITLKIR